MRVVVQRVTSATVAVREDNYSSSIEKGLMILVAFEELDTQEDIVWVARKVSSMRIFDDENGVMNLSVQDIDGEIMIVSQFTLFASTAKGNRPSYIKAAKPEIAIPLYESFMAEVEKFTGKSVARGIFGADMQISLVNDGPVTIIIDSKLKF